MLPGIILLNLPGNFLSMRLIVLSFFLLLAILVRSEDYQLILTVKNVPQKEIYLASFYGEKTSIIDTSMPSSEGKITFEVETDPFEILFMGEYGFVVLRQFQAMGIPLVNGLEGVTIARHQFITLQTLSGAGIRVPDSCFVTRADSFFTAVAQLGGYPVVVKQPAGMGGDGVVKIDDRSGAKKCVANLLDPVKGLVVQRFFPPGGRLDARILVIGGRVAGAVQLTPASSDFRTNIHQNGQARGFDPPEAWADMAVSAARVCSLDIAGIDMMVEKGGLPHVVEVNYSPGFRGLEAATGKDIAQKIIAHVLSVAQSCTLGKPKSV